VRIEYGQSIRSAITVAGIVGAACSSSRIRGSNPSTTDPAGARSYRGGLSLRSAAFTVFLEIPNTRPISEISTRSDRVPNDGSQPSPPRPTLASSRLD
jgi:hypothetical protein